MTKRKFFRTYCSLSPASLGAILFFGLAVASPDRLRAASGATLVAEDALVDIHAYAQTEGVPLEIVFFAHPRDPRARITRYAWDLGDGTRSTLSMLSKTYDTPGVYQVALRARVVSPGASSGQFETTVVRKTIHVAKMEWHASEYQLELGDKWRTSRNVPLCRGADLDCGPTRVTIDDAPNGIFELQLKLLHKAKGPGVSPESRFLFDGELKNFIPDKQPRVSWYYETMKTVAISDGRLSFVVDDLRESSVTFSRVRLRRVTADNSGIARIKASKIEGEVPLKVHFSLKSNHQIRNVSWDFGDNRLIKRWRPQHTFESMGRHTVSAVYVTKEGRRGVASFVVTARPSKIHLPGLKDIKQFGFWSSGAKSSDPEGFRQRRIARLKSMHVTHFWPYGSVDLGKRHDIGVGVQFGSERLWFRNDENGQRRKEWVFDPTQARKAMRATDRNGDGVSDLDGQEGIDWVYMGHEIGEWTTHAQRVKMRNTIKEFFPNTRVMPYYGAIYVSYERGKVAHQVGKGEGDVVCVGIADPFVLDSDKERRFDPGRAVNAVLRNKKYMAKHVPDTAFWALKSLPGEKLGSKPQNKAKAIKEMWTPEQLLDYARVLLSIGDVEAMIFRAYGRWTYDLSFGDNDKDPSRPETGFVQQRLAVKTIGGWINQARNRRPILMIRSPEIGAKHTGQTVTIRYATVNVYEDAGVPVLTLDHRRPHRDFDGNGSHAFTRVPAGNHRLRGHLERNGKKIVGSEVEVIFSTAPR